MKQKITKKLVATFVAAVTAFTLLFMAQPAQAFNVGGCLEGAAYGAVGAGSASLVGLLFKAVRAAGPAGLIVGTAGSTVTGCLQGSTKGESGPSAPSSMPLVLYGRGGCGIDNPGSSRFFCISE